MVLVLRRDHRILTDDFTRFEPPAKMVNQIMTSCGPEGSEGFNREGFNLKIQRQAQNTSARLWKLLSSYEWKRPEKKNPEVKGEDWTDDAHNNEVRSWDAFATHYIDGDPDDYRNLALSFPQERQTILDLQ